MNRSGAVMALVCGIAVVGCGGASPGSDAPSNAARASGSILVPPSPISPAPSLPPIVDIATTSATTIKATDLSDWITIGGGSIWVLGLCDGVGRLDPANGTVLPCAVIPDEPCGAMDVAYGSIWVATCAVPGVARIDPATSAVTTIRLTDVITDSESSIGAGEGGVWVVVGTAEQFLVKIDPIGNRVVDRYPISLGARGVRTGVGSVWVTNAIANTLTRANPVDGSIQATIGVGSQPLFLTVGEGGVWVLNEGDGTVSHVDPATNRVVATITIGPPFVGDIVVGDGSIWVRTGRAAGETMLIRIDPLTDRVIARYGPGVGGGGAAVADGIAWIGSEDQATIWRLPLP